MSQNKSAFHIQRPTLRKEIVDKKEDKGREELEEEERDCWLPAMPSQCDLPRK